MALDAAVLHAGVAHRRGSRLVVAHAGVDDLADEQRVGAEVERLAPQDLRRADLVQVRVRLRLAAAISVLLVATRLTCRYDPHPVNKSEIYFLQQNTHYLMSSNQFNQT